MWFAVKLKNLGRGHVTSESHAPVSPILINAYNQPFQILSLWCCEVSFICIFLCSLYQRHSRRMLKRYEHPFVFVDVHVGSELHWAHCCFDWQVVVWKRYSELKKLHEELAYTHRNLFRRQEEFPSFPRAQVFGKVNRIARHDV